MTLSQPHARFYTIRWVFLIFSILVLITSERPLILSVKQQPNGTIVWKGRQYSNEVWAASMRTAIAKQIP